MALLHNSATSVTELPSVRSVGACALPPHLAHSDCHLFWPLKQHLSEVLWYTCEYMNVKGIFGCRGWAQTFTARLWILWSRRGANTLIGKAVIVKNNRHVPWLPCNVIMIRWPDAQKPEYWSQNRRWLLGNDSVNTFPREQILKQQSSNFRCYAMALKTRLPKNKEAVFSVWSVQSGYKEELNWEE
jgi:hypothetical protein